MEMNGAEQARRKALQTAVAALCIEVGFVSADSEALGSLSEILQSYITELGRTGRLYSELAQRTEPTVSDVQLALIDSGVDVNSLPEYSRRPQKRHLHRQSKSYQQPQPKTLQVGVKVQRPSNIPSYLPPFPDPHTYIKTPTFSNPPSDYRIVREKLAEQKRSARKAYSTLVAKTHPSQPIAGENDPYGLYTDTTHTQHNLEYLANLKRGVPQRKRVSSKSTIDFKKFKVVKVEPVTSPLYLKALMPTPEDEVDTVAVETREAVVTGGEEGVGGERGSGVRGDASSSEVEAKGEQIEHMDTSSQSLDKAPENAPDAYENPFVKLLKRM